MIRETPDGAKDILSRPYIPETLPEGLDPDVILETRQEIVDLLSESGWQRAKETVLEFSQHGYNPTFLSAAAEMHRFDPVRFSREVQFSPDDFASFRDSRVTLRNPDLKIAYAAALKRLDPQRFTQENPVSPEEWGDALGRAWSALNFESTLVQLRDLKELNPEAFQERIQGRWQELRAMIEKGRPDPQQRDYEERVVDYILYAGLAQGMKPKGDKDFEVSQLEWRVFKGELGRIQDHGDAPARFFRLANAASRLRIG